MMTEQPSNQSPQHFPPSRMGWWATLRAGQHYRKTWPQQKSLTPVFKEMHVIKITHFAIFWMPPFIVFSFCWAIMLHSNLAIATSAALAAASIPIQCLYWLGKRSHSPLPIGLIGWLSEIIEKLQAAGIEIPLRSGTPNYQYLADVLNIAFKQLDHSFGDSL